MQQEKHQCSTSSNVTSRPGESHAAGVTYWRWTANSSSSVAPQLSHVSGSGTRRTLTPGPAYRGRMSRRLLRRARSAAVCAALIAVGAACSDPTGGSASTAAPSTPVPITTLTRPASSPAQSISPTTVPVPAISTPGIAPEGFDLVAARITAADGSTCDVCLWAALTPLQRAQGLMGVTDLSGADGMLFRWEAPTTSQFWMRDTPTPLSIAWFAADGAFVSSADMTPCLEGPDEACARYSAAGPYSDAIEVAEGALPELSIGPGSHLTVLDAPCQP